mgnify:CR=1 FL=1
MMPDQFWTSPDGQILAVKNKDERHVAMTLAFWPRNSAELEFLQARLADLRFSERSSLARIGVEMRIRCGPRLEGGRIEMEVDAVSARKLALWALLPTLLAVLCLGFLRG